MKYLVALLVLVALFAGLRLGVHLMSRTPVAAGLSGQQLGACPTTPNCVHSMATDAEHQVDPLRLPNLTSLADIATRLQSLPGYSVESVNQQYLHATSRTRIWGFVDDLEIATTESPNEFQIRSASRLGVSDLGANRQRVETLQALLTSPTTQ